MDAKSAPLVVGDAVVLREAAGRRDLASGAVRDARRRRRARGAGRRGQRRGDQPSVRSRMKRGPMVPWSSS